MTQLKKKFQQETRRDFSEVKAESSFNADTVAADGLKWILQVVFDRQCNKCCMHKRTVFLKGQHHLSEKHYCNRRCLDSFGLWGREQDRSSDAPERVKASFCYAVHQGGQLSK